MLLKKRKLLFAVLLFLLIPVLSYAQVCETAKVKEVLKKTLHLYFTQKNISITKNQIKDLLTFYLSINSQNLITDCSALGTSTNQQIIDIVNFADNLPDTVPYCKDGTKYGECSNNKPGYCFAGKIYNKCQLCGCPANSRCGSNGACAKVSWNTECFGNLDCGKSEFIGSYYCLNNYITKNYVNYTCIKPGTANAKCVSNNGTIYLTYCDPSLNQFCVSGQSACVSANVTVSNQTNQTVIGACIIRDDATDVPLLFAPDLGKGYAKIEEYGFKGTSGLLNYCTQTIYKQLLQAYCNKNKNPVQEEIATYNQDGTIKSIGCGAFGCEKYDCASLTNTTTISGACEIFANVIPYGETFPEITFYSPDLGKYYAKASKPGINTIEGLKSACTAGDYATLLKSYCTINTQTVTQEVATFGPGGGWSSNSCGLFGCQPWSCAAVGNTTPISGACIVRDSSTDMPTFYDPDLGKGYAKIAKPGVNTTAWLMSACTADDYAALLKSYCTINSNPVQEEVVNYLTGSSGCGPFGCDYWSCASIGNTTLFSGACVIRNGYTSIPTFYDPDLGKGYAKLAKPGVNNLSGLQSACTAADYAALLKSYCTINTEDVIEEVVTYGPTGGSSTCGAFGCGSFSCISLINTTLVSGACAVIDSYTTTPSFYAPDLGNGYAKLAKPGVNSINGLKTACTASDYSSLLKSYCTINSNRVQAEVLNYGPGGGVNSSTCGGIGCGDLNCSSIIPTIPQCNDGIDNDGDGKIDYPNDPGCIDYADNNETDTIANTCYDTDNGINFSATGTVYGIRNGIAFNHTDYCDVSGSAMKYNCTASGWSGYLYSCGIGRYCSSGRCFYLGYQCSDGKDNDGDTKIDYPNDPGCTSVYDNNERGTNACDDGIDNDVDGKIDYPNDTTCLSPSGTSEG